MRAKFFKPGEAVPESGIYSVHHDSHRLMHASTLLGGGKFPICRKCGDAVRFKLIRTVRDRQVLPFRSNAIFEEYQPRPRIVGKG